MRTHSSLGREADFIFPNNTHIGPVDSCRSTAPPRERPRANRGEPRNVHLALASAETSTPEEFVKLLKKSLKISLISSKRIDIVK